MSEKRIDKLDYIRVLVAWKKKILVNFILVSVLAVLFSLVVPQWFRSYATIMPPVDQSGGLGLSAIMDQIPISGAFGMGGVSNEASMVLAIFNSRTVMEEAARRFNLQEEWEQKTMQETIKKLRKRVETTLNDDGTISFSVMAKSPWFPTLDDNTKPAKDRAFNMLSFFLEKMDSLNRTLKIESATNTRMFIEKRYRQNQQDLAEAEEEFKEFQEKYGAIALPEQTVATIEAIAQVKAQSVAQEIQLNILRSYLDESHPEVEKAQKQLVAIEETMEQFTTSDGEDGKIFLPLDQVPEIGVEYARLFREVELQAEIMKFLLPQYEQAKIQEMRDTPTIQILDEPKYPERKAKPKRALIVLLAAFLSLFGFVVAAYIHTQIEFLKKTDYEKYQKWHAVWSDLSPALWLKKRG